MEWQTDYAYLAGTYNRFPVEIVSGAGSKLTDVTGKTYIDLGSGIAVNAFGAADPAWQKAVADQISKVQHTSNLYYTQPGGVLARMLCQRTGMKKVFFSNSGAEANECAIKTARKYAAEHKDADHFTVVTLQNSFHGRTLATLAATGQEVFHKDFLPLTPGFVSTPANDAGALMALAKECKAAAIMMEPVQGEGGVMPLDKGFVQAVAAFAAKEDILLIVDEVQTGNGRTGTLYAYEQYGITPDIVTTAKGLGGGLPIGATLLGEKVQDTLRPGDHGSTFGGNPVCCAGAISVLSRIDDALLDEVREKSAYIFEELTGAPGVDGVSGLGLMIGIATQKPAGEVVKSCLENGVLCLTAKTKVRLLPALNIPWEQLKTAVAVLKAACAG